jgi:demethylmenaquinone methyltransferase/2-methoxy-6-polyprenyl-1,4-benzoquinol methylase
MAGMQAGTMSEMRTYYGARALEYDRVYAKPERQDELRAMERWLPAQLRGRRVLEVACGTGYWTQFVAPVARSVVAIDAVPEPLEVAQRRICRRDVTFVLGDAYHLPFDSGAFDATFAGFWLSHVPRSRRLDFLLHVGERVQPGSPVILFDNLYVEGSSTSIAESDAEGNTYQLRTLGNGAVHRVLKNFPTERELLTLAGSIGERAQFLSWRHYWALAYVTPDRQQARRAGE